MDLLFRPVFVRVKTPVPGSSSFPEHSPSFATEDNNEDEEGANRLRTTSRVSSYIGFRQTTPPIPVPETFPNLHDPDNVYHKPPADQQAEMLKVVMMNQSCMDSVPVQYNSTILHVLEAYQDLRMQLNGREETIEVLKQTHTKDIKDFEELAAEWQQKESDYKIELKNLEVLLSMTEDGLESVAMARSNSVIHGAEKASTLISRGIGTIKARNAATNSKVADIDPSELKSLRKTIKYRRSFQIREDRDLDTTAGFAFRHKTPKKRATLDPHSRAERSWSSQSSLHLHDSLEVRTQKVSPHGSIRQLQPLTKCQLEALERQEALELGVAFESSESGADSSSISHRSEFPVMPGSQGLGIEILEKPLPNIPISSEERAKQTTLQRFLHARKHSYSDPNKASEYGKRTASDQMGFSFRPGDDEDLLGRRAERDRTTRRTVDEYLEHCSSPLRSVKSRRQTPPCDPESSPQEERAMRPTIKSKSSTTGLNTSTAPTRPSQLPRIQDHDQLSRMDSSSSSVVTAVRHNSSRSSAGNSQIGRPNINLNAGSGGNEAVTATSRAFAGNRRSPTVSRKDSAAESGSGSHAKIPIRNDSGGDKNVVTSRKPSTASGTSSVSGSEFGGMKAAGAGKRKEKSQ